MIVRLVKMEFKAEEVDHFIKLFDEVKSQIRGFEGCAFLELLKGEQQSTIFFTHSYWSSAEALENYRKSELFTTTWAKTKVLFNAKPEAWSVEKFITLL